MSSVSEATVPVALFAFARPEHTTRVLDTLRRNRVALIYAYADGTTNPAMQTRVAAVRELLHAVDWCEMHVIERNENFGLGRNIRSGVGEVLTRHPCCIVWEDDLIAVPGTYAWVCAALQAYADVPEVMSISAWTHPRVTPADVGDRPYLDARAECWVWGTWARAWRGMEDGDARQKMRVARERGITPGAYGADLPEQARREHEKNTWAVRWLYHHFAQGGLCVRPPWSMVEHIGFDATATNAATANEWANPPLRSAPPIPDTWPEPHEHPACRPAWRQANPRRNWMVRLGHRLRSTLTRVLP